MKYGKGQERGGVPFELQMIFKKITKQYLVNFNKLNAYITIT